MQSTAFCQRDRAQPSSRIQNTERSPREPSPNAPFGRRRIGARDKLSGPPRAARAAQERMATFVGTQFRLIGRQHRKPDARAQGRKRRLTATAMKRPVAGRGSLREQGYRDRKRARRNSRAPNVLHRPDAGPTRPNSSRRPITTDPRRTCTAGHEGNQPKGNRPSK